MSAKLMGTVWDLNVSHGKQLVLLALADHAHDDGTHCYPGVPYLSWKTGYTERNVTRILTSLKEDGLITPDDFERPGGRGVVTGYVLTLEEGEKKDEYAGRKPGKRVTTRTRERSENPDKSDKKGDNSNTNPDKSDKKGDNSASRVERCEPSLNRQEPSVEPLEAEASEPTGPAKPDPNPSPPYPGNPTGQAPTGGMFVRLFDEALERIRAARPGEERKSLSGKWRKNLRRAADRELEAGRDPGFLVKAVSRLALRIDGYSGMELADAINDVLGGKPWTVEQHERTRRALGDPDFAWRESTQRHREGYEWLFGDGAGEGGEDIEGEAGASGEAVSERERLIREEEERRLEEEAEKRWREIEAERERAEHIRFVGSLMAEWIRDLDDKEYSRKVFNLKQNAEANSLTEDDVDRLDGEVREAHRNAANEADEEAS